MDPVMTEKMQTILESKNGEKIINIFEMAAYFAHDIRNGVFAQGFSSSSEVNDAIQFLQRLALIELSEGKSSFSLPCETRSKLQEHLCNSGTEEDVLKRAASLLNESKEVEYPHLQSVYNAAKIYPSLIEDVYKFPGKIIFGMLIAEKFKEAYEFGTISIEYLSSSLGEFHRAVMELKTFLTFTLLVMMKPKDEATSLLEGIYKKWYQVSGYESYGALLKMITHAFEHDRCDTSRYEGRVREMIFLGKKASDISECLNFEKWVLYCEILIRLRVIKKSMAILDEVLERGKVLFGKEEVCIVNAMHIKALGLIEELKLREAMDLLNDIFEKRKEKFGPMNLKTLYIQIDIGKFLTINKEYDVSKTLFEEITNRLEQVVGKTHELYLVAKENMVEVYRKMHDMEKAYELALSLTDTLVSYYGVFHPKTYKCKFSLGEILLEMQKYREARKIFKDLLEITKKSSAPKEETWLLQLRIFTTENSDRICAPSFLHLAAKDGGEEVHFRIGEGRHLEAQDFTSSTPDKGFKDTWRSLLAHGAVCNVQYAKVDTPLLFSQDDGYENLEGLVEELFLDVKNGDIEAVRGKLNGLKVDDVISVTKAKNEENRNLLQEARKLNHLELVKELQKFTLKDE